MTHRPPPNPGDVRHFAHMLGMVAGAADRFDWSGIDLGDWQGEPDALGRDIRLLTDDLEQVAQELAEDLKLGNQIALESRAEKRRDRADDHAADMRELLGV